MRTVSISPVTVELVVRLYGTLTMSPTRGCLPQAPGRQGLPRARSSWGEAAKGTFPHRCEAGQGTEGHG